MIEIPESIVYSNQLNETVSGKTIVAVTANQNPHKFAWFNGDSGKYAQMLKGKKLGSAKAFGGKVEIAADDMALAFSEGINLRWIDDKNNIPKKHQLFLELDNGTFLAASVQMYGGLWAFKAGSFDNEYYLKAKSAIDPLTDSFDFSYFNSVICSGNNQNLSAKAFLATEQRFPGLGNGVLQDILYNAKVNPKTKMNTLSEQKTRAMFNSVKSTLKEIVDKGGRDTEKDLFGRDGGYKTKASKMTVGSECPECKKLIQKASYMGGSVYYCEGCQPVIS